MSPGKAVPIATACVLLALGCRQLPSDAGFREVRAEVAERTGFEPARAGGDSTRDARVDEWLAGELTAEEAVRVALVRNPDLQALYEGLAVRRASDAELERDGIRP